MDIDMDIDMDMDMDMEDGNWGGKEERGEVEKRVVISHGAFARPS